MVRHTTRTAAALLAMSVSFAPVIALAEEAVQPQPKQILPSIVVTKAAVRPLVERIVATGTIRPVEEVFVQPLVEGLSIKSLDVDVGDKIAADGVVARLNDDTLLLQKSQLLANRAKAEAAVAQYQAQLADAKASNAEAARQYKRSQTLAKSGTLSVSQLEQSETAATSAAAKVTTAEKAIAMAEADIKVVDSQIEDIDLKLARTDVKSPVAGMVATRTAKIGAIASGAGEPLFTVIRDGEIELVADVSETDILRLAPGQTATITVAGGLAKLTGSVRLVSPTVDAVTRLGKVHVSIDEDEKARSGMFANGEIVISKAEALALPLTAVTTGRDSAFTRVVADGVVKQVEVKTGIQDGAHVEIREGLKAGDQVVAKAGAFVRDGDRITPIAEETAAASN